MKKLVRKIRLLLPRFLSRKSPKEIELAEINARESRKLNLSYRNKNKPANVLSFRYGQDYGEILICPATIRREAKAQGNTYKYQMTWMIIHGMLHLAGLHHERSRREEQRAAVLEKRVLAKLGLRS